MAKEKKDSLLFVLLDIAETPVTAVFCFIFVFTFVVRLVTLSGTSMESTFGDGDVLLLRNLMYTPKQGDVVVVNSDVLDKFIIKRVVAVAGQKVVIDYNSDKVYVCARDSVPDETDALDEPYILEHDMNDPEYYYSESCYDKEAECYVYIVPAGHVFVLGDNRNNSTDSRSIGPVDISDVEGKAVFRFYSPEGKGFGKVD